MQLLRRMRSLNCWYQSSAFYYFYSPTSEFWVAQVLYYKILIMVVDCLRKHYHYLVYKSMNCFVELELQSQCRRIIYADSQLQVLYRFPMLTIPDVQTFLASPPPPSTSAKTVCSTRHLLPLPLSQAHNSSHGTPSIHPQPWPQPRLPLLA